MEVKQVSLNNHPRSRGNVEIGQKSEGLFINYYAHTISTISVVRRGSQDFYTAITATRREDGLGRVRAWLCAAFNIHATPRG